MQPKLPDKSPAWAEQAGQRLTPSPAQPGFSFPLWGQLSLGPCCQPSLVSWASCGILRRLEANADLGLSPALLQTLQGAETASDLLPHYTCGETEARGMKGAS